MKKLNLLPLALLLLGMTVPVFAWSPFTGQSGSQGTQNSGSQIFQRPGPQGIQNPGPKGIQNFGSQNFQHPGGFHAFKPSQSSGEKRTMKPNRIKMINNQRLS